MRLLVSIAWALPLLAQPGTYFACGPDAGAWEKILTSVNFSPASRANASLVTCDVSGTRSGALVTVLTGDSKHARELGFVPSEESITVRNIVDLRSPDLKIVWKEPVSIRKTAIPSSATVFVRERWTGTPLVAGLRTPGGSFLWLAAGPGQQGFERFPYLLQALADLGLESPWRSRRLWAFFDSSYRSRVDLDYFARRWRDAGIAALHIASWHYMEADAGRDQYLRDLIEACHRHSILVYAWIEFPHVSEAFWEQHPEWREKTALLQDAHLDWRRLMNLANPECAKAAGGLLAQLLDRFDWDGANLAELYFESPLGYANAARFTPMNDDVRAMFRSKHGFDPLEAFTPASPRYYGKNARAMRAFLDFRATLAFELQTDWVRKLQEVRKSKPHLDLVLTHVDDRLDQTMRDTIGADAPRTLAFAEQQQIRFLIEDPATVWDRGPKRYVELAGMYAKIAKRPDLLSIDINIVDRYQDVYPTRQQTGTEFLQLVNLASRAFPQVALYFEASISKFDLPLLSSAAAIVSAETGALRVGDGTGMRWEGPAEVNGQVWPFQDTATVWLPQGRVVLRPAAETPPFRVLDFTAVVTDAKWTGGEFSWSYQSNPRVLVTFDRPVLLSVDGGSPEPQLRTAWLPPGRHRASVRAAMPQTD